MQLREENSRRTGCRSQKYDTADDASQEIAAETRSHF